MLPSAFSKEILGNTLSRTTYLGNMSRSQTKNQGRWGDGEGGVPSICHCCPCQPGAPSSILNPLCKGCLWAGAAVGDHLPRLSTAAKWTVWENRLSLHWRLRLHPDLGKGPMDESTERRCIHCLYLVLPWISPWGLFKKSSSSLNVSFLDVALSSDFIFGFYDTLPWRAKLWWALRKFEW